MRTYDEMIVDYLKWYSKNTGMKNYEPDQFLGKVTENELIVRKALVWQNILKMSYRQDDGLYWFAKFILGDLKYAGYPEKIQFNSLLHKWMKISHQGNHIAIKCARQHSKCCGQDTLIALANNRFKLMKDIDTNDKILSYNELTGDIEIDRVLYKECVGKKEKFIVTTQSGRSITLAKTHPLLTRHGWEIVEKLNPGDQIATPIHKKLFNPGHGKAKNLVWDPIISIIHDGTEELMFDIEVRYNHNYIGNGIYSHNSTFWSVLQPIYRMALFANYNVLIESASERQAIMLLGYITNIIERNEFLTSKKSPKAKWSTTELTYNNGSLLATGVGSEIRGFTYDYVIADDLLRSDNKMSDDDIEKFLDEEIEPTILARKGQLVLVGTVKSSSDIFATIEKRIESTSAIHKKNNDDDEDTTPSKGWKMFTYPAILDWENKQLLCPTRFTWDQLMEEREIMGEMKFNKEFQCIVYDSGTQLFAPSLREQAKQKGLFKTLQYRIQPQPDCSYYVGVDTARSGAASADYSVAIVVELNNRTNEKTIVWMWRQKGLKISEQVEQLNQINKNFNHPIFLVEQNNMGQEFIDLMRDNYGITVESFTTSNLKKEELIRMLIVAFEQGKIIMPQADQFSRDQIKILDQELDKFVIETTHTGTEIMKGSGKSKDDCVISLALANRCTQVYGGKAFCVSLPKKTADYNMTPLERYANSGDINEIIKWKFY